MKSATADVALSMIELPARRRLNFSGLPALFLLTLRQSVRGRRLLILSLLFLLPSVLALVIRLAPHPPPRERLEFNIIFNFIPHALAPLAALLFATGVIQDEVEEQTLTYLLLRPLPRPALYLTKLAAIWVVTVLLTTVFTTLAFAVIWWGSPELWRSVLPERAAKTAGLLALAQVGYCALFGAMGLYLRRSLISGLAYIVGFEGIIANIPFVVRQLTVMYYFRVLAVRWLAPDPKGSDIVSTTGTVLSPIRQQEPSAIKEWSLNLSEAPSSARCVQTLLMASAILLLLGLVMMARREFRMKTPEGS